MGTTSGRVLVLSIWIWQYAFCSEFVQFAIHVDTHFGTNDELSNTEVDELGSLMGIRSLAIGVRVLFS